MSLSIVWLLCVKNIWHVINAFGSTVFFFFINIFNTNNLFSACENVSNNEVGNLCKTRNMLIENSIVIIYVTDLLVINVNLGSCSVIHELVIYTFGILIGKRITAQTCMQCQMYFVHACICLSMLYFKFSRFGHFRVISNDLLLEFPFAGLNVCNYFLILTSK